MKYNLTNQLIHTLFQNQFDRVFQKSGKLNLEEFSFEELSSIIDETVDAKLIHNYGKSNVPKIIGFMPKTKLETKVLRSLLSSFTLFPFWENDFNLESLWVKLGANFSNLFQCISIETFSDNSKKELKFQISDFYILKISWNDIELFFCIDDHLADAIQSKIQSEEQIKNFSQKISEDIQKNHPPKKIFPKLQIENMKEFEIGNFLIPRSFHWGNIKVKSKVRYVRESHAKDPEEVAFWFGVSLAYEDKSYYLQYAFPHQKLDKPDEVQMKYQSLLVNLLKTSIGSKWSQLPISLQKSGTKALDKPIEQLFDKGILVEYEIKVNQSNLLCHVLIPQNLINFLVNVQKDKLIGEFSEPLYHFINLNRSLIRNKYAENYQVFFHQTESREYPILLFEFLNMLGDNDLKLVLQNYFVASGIKTIDFQKLLFYLTTDSLTQTKSLFLDEDLDENRMKRLIPVGMQKDWDTFPVNSENITGLTSIAYSLEEFILKNREVMQSIYQHCIDGKLEISKKARYILYIEFAKLIEEELLKKLSEINQKYISLLDKLKDVPKATVQQFFYTFKSDELGAIFLDLDAGLLKAQPFVSKKFYQEVVEDLVSKNTLRKKQALDLNVVLSLKERFIKELTAITSEEFV